MSVLLQPSSGKVAMQHFEDTITNGVPLMYFKGKIAEHDFEKLKNQKEGRIRVWGFVPGVKGRERSEWVDLSEGDLVLFYAQKAFYYAAFVYLKIHNPGIAEELWGRDEQGRTWEYIYFVKEGKQVSAPYKPELLGYAPNHRVMGATLLSGDRASAIVKLLDEHEGGVLNEEGVRPSEQEEATLAQKTSEIRTVEEAEREIKKLSASVINKPVRERIRTAKLLVRNPRFSRLVKEKSAYICEICGEKPFQQKNGMPYAEAHHKLELAKERIDNPEDMICVCPTCHRVIHFGSDAALRERQEMRE